MICGQKIVNRVSRVLLLLAVPGLLCAAPDSLDQQRESYRRIKQEFRDGGTLTYLKKRDSLKTYPLYAELEYRYLYLALGLKTNDEISAFLDRYPDHWQAGQLRTAWLQFLYKKGRWSEMESYFLPEQASTALHCQFRHAQYLAGKKEPALAEGLKLWMVGVSQPKECDPLFQLLAAEKRITEEVAWQRFVEATRKENHALAQFVTGYLKSPEHIAMADNIRLLRGDPTQLDKFGRSFEKRPETLHIVGQAIGRLAKVDAPRALRYWQEYRQKYLFDEETQSQVLTHLVKGLHGQEHPKQAMATLDENMRYANDQLLDWQLQVLLKARDWDAISLWLNTLPAATTQEEQWQYWQARVGLLRRGSMTDGAILMTMKGLADKRSYYGFLASDWLQEPYQMQHRPVSVLDWEQEKMAKTPGMQRAKEHFYHQEFFSANREWYLAISNLSDSELLVAAQLADHWQWPFQAIITLAKAEYWDDIDLRFPLAYKPQFVAQAEKLQLSPPLIFALSRQESAFMPFAVSPSGARGLMQLMPGTAMEVARRHGIPYKHNADLDNPTTNIRLGSQYYKNMMQRFGSNRILATAAYNAGPGRVAQWLKESNGQLPFDVWIETIPFNETRKYVKNVLAYSVIFGHHLGDQAPVITQIERDKTL